jgi:hypothetical protein
LVDSLKMSSRGRSTSQSQKSKTKKKKKAGTKKKATAKGRGQSRGKSKGRSQSRGTGSESKKGSKAKKRTGKGKAKAKTKARGAPRLVTDIHGNQHVYTGHSSSSTRKSPANSATEFRPGYVLEGLDGRDWMVKQDSRGVQKWVPVK